MLHLFVLVFQGRVRAVQHLLICAGKRPKCDLQNQMRILIGFGNIWVTLILAVVTC